MNKIKVIDLIQDNMYYQKMTIKKSFIEKQMEFPGFNSYIKLKVIDDDNDDNYIFDINKKQAISIRCTYQNRYNTNVILFRLDINTKKHRNPDERIISGKHIHVYTEEYQDSYAFELNDPILNLINPKFNLKRFETDNLFELFEAFAEFCRISKTPIYNISI